MSYLKKIFKAVCCHLPHFRGIPGKASDCISSKGRCNSISKEIECWLTQIDMCTTYLWSSSWIEEGLTSCRMRIRWMKSDFQTPSSTSWRKSTTNMSNTLKFGKELNRSEKAFYRENILYEYGSYLYLIQVLGNRLTLVGIYDSSLSKSSTTVASTGRFST